MLTIPEFESAVRTVPLVAIDLIVLNGAGEMLLGWRNNPPAQACWFVPGGRIYKGEALNRAFSRITEAEIGTDFQLDQTSFLGVFDHIYHDDFTGSEHNGGCHYVVLAHQITIDHHNLSLPESQHSAFRWFSKSEALKDASIHDNTKAYFRMIS